MMFADELIGVCCDMQGWEMLTKSLLPLPDKWHGLTDVNKRYRERHLDLIVNPKVRYTFDLVLHTGHRVIFIHRPQFMVHPPSPRLSRAQQLGAVYKATILISADGSLVLRWFR
jgi:hypothetical protein